MTSDPFGQTSVPPIIGAPGAGRTLLAMRLSRSTLARLPTPLRPRLVVVVDWRVGLTEQIATQVAVFVPSINPTVVLVINHLDRAGFEYETFKAARKQALDALSARHVLVSAVLPISARLGEGIERNTDRTEWHVGPTLVEVLSRGTKHAPLATSMGPSITAAPRHLALAA